MADGELVLCIRTKNETRARAQLLPTRCFSASTNTVDRQEDEKEHDDSALAAVAAIDASGRLQSTPKGTIHGWSSRYS